MKDQTLVPSLEQTDFHRICAHGMVYNVRSFSENVRGNGGFFIVPGMKSHIPKPSEWDLEAKNTGVIQKIRF